MEQVNFEALLKELEETVKKLEDKNISLDEAVKLYQKGIELSQKLATLMSQAEQLLVIEK